jgi:hypothetical protein
MADLTPKCPLPRTHARLGQAHRLWHESLIAYPNPDTFRSRLNSLIQETRNVTWILQYEKRVIPSFDEWYGEWQAQAGKDAVLRWLVDARNRVVKRGDLETKSTAIVKVLASYIDANPVKVFEVPPHLGPQGVAARVKVSGMPDELRDAAVILVERRWVESTLSDWELLDALGYCYKNISLLIAQAHERIGVSMLSDDVETRSPTGHPVGSFIPGKQECMSTTPEMRTAALKLATGEFMTVETTTRDLRTLEETKAIASIRYGIEKQYDGVMGSDNVVDGAETFLETGKKILATDKRHVQMLFLFPKEGPPLTRMVILEDRSEKFVFWQRIADEVKRKDIVALVSIAEVWTANLSDLQPGMKGGEDVPNRGEGLQVVAADSTGRTRALTATFTRAADGSINFGETRIHSEKEFTPQYLTAVFDVWRGNRG